MNLENLDDKSRSYLASVRLTAMGLSHQHIIPEHLIQVLLEDRECAFFLGMKKVAGSLEGLFQHLEEAFAKEPKIESTTPIEPLFGQRITMLFSNLDRISRKLKKEGKITPDVLALAVVQSKDKALLQLWQDCHIAIKDVETFLLKRQENGEDKEKTALEKYGIDLTERSSMGKLDPVMSRDEEIRRVAQILMRRSKNNPVLIGEPGVGKTAIVEGLANRIVEGDVPSILKNKRLVMLDLSLMLAGAKFRGEFEERMKAVLAEITEAEGELICFIDELHTLVGAGSSDGAMDASNMLKPALSRGELHCIGATTLDEYRKYIEKDTALARRFQPVRVAEPTEEETLAILRGLRDKYELHHGITITDHALLAAVKLSKRYINDRFLPDKAIDLVDEAASRMRMILDSKPEELDNLERKMIRMKMEIEARTRDMSEGITLEDGRKPKESTEDSLANLRQQLARLEEKAKQLNHAWSEAKSAVLRSQELQSSLEKARYDMGIAQQDGRYDEAGKLAYDVIPRLEKRLSEDKRRLTMMVRKEDIASVVARWTGIPIENMMEAERERLLKMEDILGKRVFGQKGAIKAVSEAIRRNRAGIGDEHRPVGTFLFLGPTGVGKTELAKAIAQFLFADEKALTRIDMSEYMEKHSVARLVGAPPGYVGYEEGGTLTTSLQRKPYQVILFDEIEKAHPDVFLLFLQLLDEGRLTDGQGRLVDARHALMIMTSNLGATHLLEGESTEIHQDIHEKVMKEVRLAFKPEFLNRLDDILMFQKLSKEDMGHIVDLRMAALSSRLAEHGGELSISEAAKQWLVREGIDHQYGARPMNRLIRKSIETPLAHMILREEQIENFCLNIEEEHNKLVIHSAKRKE